ncbi:hypothetical protein ABZ419_09900 [Streptomyces cinnamoneus]|uniref:deoxynucleotide monophosphate kinase family protein n=1 Tax=Streptomyces cinnamoneus TaxID=53446 RepID=UPI0033F8AF08
MEPIIGLSGPAGSGKNTAVGALIAAGWQQRAFADKVKGFLVAMNPTLVDGEVVEGYSLAEHVDAFGWDLLKKDPVVRGLLQRCGTEAGRGVLGENVWVDALFHDAETWGPTVITDVRFPNEAEAIRERGGLVVRIKRPSGTPIREADHTSETALDEWPFDAVLINDGTVEDLREQLKALTQR